MASFNTNFDGNHGPTVYELADGRISQRSNLGEISAELRDVTAVHLNEFQGMGGCELKLQTGESFHVNSGDAKHGVGADYSAFVRALHEELAASGRPIRYVRGSWFLVGVYVVIAAVVAAAAALVHFDVITPPAGFAIRSKVLIGFAVAVVAVAPFLMIRARPRSYDPRAIPDRFLPRGKTG